MGKKDERLAWRVFNLTHEIADVDIFDVIGDPWGDGVNASDFVAELRSLNVERINFHINSPGGYVNDAIAMYNAVRSHPAETFGYVIGAADSAASFLLQAMGTRVIAKNASMFIHPAQGLVFGNAHDATEMATVLQEQSENIASIYAERAGGDADEWLARMDAGRSGHRGTNYRGKGAVDVGLCDEVGISETVTAAHMERIAALNTPKDDDDAQSSTPLAIPPLGSRLGYKPPTPDLAGLLSKHPITFGGK